MEESTSPEGTCFCQQIHEKRSFGVETWKKNQFLYTLFNKFLNQKNMHHFE